MPEIIFADPFVDPLYFLKVVGEELKDVEPGVVALAVSATNLPGARYRTKPLVLRERAGSEEPTGLILKLDVDNELSLDETVRLLARQPVRKNTDRPDFRVEEYQPPSIVLSYSFGGGKRLVLELYKNSSF